MIVRRATVSALLGALLVTMPGALVAQGSQRYPDVRSMPVTDALTALTRAGFVPVVVDSVRSGTAAAGTVVEQEPDPSIFVGVEFGPFAGDEIRLTVARAILSNIPLGMLVQSVQRQVAGHSDSGATADEPARDTGIQLERTDTAVVGARPDTVLLTRLDTVFLTRVDTVFLATAESVGPVFAPPDEAPVRWIVVILTVVLSAGVILGSIGTSAGWIASSRPRTPDAPARMPARPPSSPIPSLVTTIVDESIEDTCGRIERRALPKEA